jgi:predicted ATPase
VSVFIGRARELRLLEELLAASAGPKAVLITGVAGAGKSRLLAEARRLAPGSAVLAITGFESEHQVPLAAAGQLLRRLARVPSHGEALDALLVGRMADHRIDGPRLDGGPLEPLRIFEAAHRALQAIGPALLIVDDLQWVDELSMALCHFLVRGAVETRQPLVVLAATRPGLGAEPLLDSLPADSIRLLEIGPLDRTDALALVQALDPSLDEPAAAKLYAQAQGEHLLEAARTLPVTSKPLEPERDALRLRVQLRGGRLVE